MSLADDPDEEPEASPRVHERGQSGSELIEDPDGTKRIVLRYPSGQIDTEWVQPRDGDTVLRTYYPSGRRKGEFAWEDGVTNGPGRTWYESGQVELEGNV